MADLHHFLLCILGYQNCENSGKYAVSAHGGPTDVPIQLLLRFQMHPQNVANTPQVQRPLRRIREQPSTVR